MPRFNNKRKHPGGSRGGGGGGGRPFRKRGRGGSRGSFRGGGSRGRSREDTRGVSRDRASGGDVVSRGRPVRGGATRPPAPQPAWREESESEEEPSALEEVLRMVGVASRRTEAVESDSEGDGPADDDDASESGDSGERDDSYVESDGGVIDGDGNDASDDESEGERTGETGDDKGVQSEADSGEKQDEDGSEEDELDGIEETEEDVDPQEAEDAPATAFSRHFEVNLPECVGESLLASARWQQEQQQWPELGQLLVQHRPADSTAAPLSAVEEVEQVEVYCSPTRKTLHDPHAYGIRQQIADHVTTVNEALFSEAMTPLQMELLSVLGDYRDLYYPARTLENEEELRVAYCAHALSHVIRTRARIVHHNSKLSKKEEVPDSYRDQGLTRPKVLIVAPFKNSAYKIINTLITLQQPDGQSSVLRYKRFADDFGDGEAPPPPAHRPSDFLATFAGNTDDAFRIGLQVTKKSMRLYSDFYHSDVIVTSPLGLRTVLGAEGEADRDVDFLNSIELLIMDQTDVFLMQNWEHVLHLLQHLHLQPRDSHGVDFARVRYWTLNGWQRLYRQTVVLSALPMPEINALVRRHCENYAGRVMVQTAEEVGTIQQVVVQVPQAFHRFPAESLAAEPDDRFAFFVEKILPQYREPQMNHTLVLVPSYFDYVRVRNHFIKETVNFVQVCEYTKDSRVSRARDMFYHGKRHFLLYTERFHYFRRYRIKGIRHVIFYGLPMYPNLYSEICNLMQDLYQNPRAEQSGSSAVTVTALFSKFDRLKLVRVVGAARAASMIAADKRVHMFVTGGS